MAEELKQLEKDIEAVLGHPLNGSDRILEALTHRSYVNESSDRSLCDNERYEFLGDAVLQLVVSDALMHKHPDESEGALSKYRSTVVNERSLAQVARAMDLGRFIRLGRGEELTQGRRKDSILANAFEAILAAIYVSGGIEDARKFVQHFMGAALSSVTDQVECYDFKTALQEMTQRLLKKVPYYRLVLEAGPDHDKVFESEVVVDDRVYGRGRAKSKKDSEQLCAAEAIRTLEGESGGPDRKGDG